MATTNETLMNVDWGSLPKPHDDGEADHLPNFRLPPTSLPSTNGESVILAEVPGKSVVYIYPRTGKPGESNPEGWDTIPGARGCTPQSCAFRDRAKELYDLGIDHIFGLSTQDTGYQKEAATRLHLPFPVLSDEKLALTNAMNLPKFEVDGVGTLLKRMVLLIDNGTIIKVFYPVFPPDGSAQAVLDYLRQER